MTNKKINKISPKSKVLVAPLDWGLGHSTRCIPIIKELLANGCEVIIAAEKASQFILQREFQQVTFIALKGYRIRYATKSKWLPLKIISQVPRILLSIYQEHKWVKKVVKNYSINAIISDNRFGLYHSGIPCVYITHQLLIKTGRNFSEKIAQKIHFWFIKKYTCCWVPDFKGSKNIAGELSHLLKYPANVKYIGGLSRLEKRDIREKSYNLLIIISGPEPQRSVFESILLSQLKNYQGKTLFLRGVPGVPEKDLPAFDKKIENQQLVIKNHLSAQELSDAIQQAELVISRSGYTTIMDLVKLRQRAVLVPTPGQTEQEYLASHVMNQSLFYTTSQDEFILTDVLKKANDFQFTVPVFDMEQYKKEVLEFVQSLHLS